MPFAIDTTAYSYDGLGRLTGIAYPSGIGVGYGYNAASQLLAITATVNGVTTTVAVPSGYQLFGPAQTLDYGNGLWRQTNYQKWCQGQLIRGGRPTTIPTAA